MQVCNLIFWKELFFAGQDGGVLILWEWRKPFCTHSLSSSGAITIIIIIILLIIINLKKNIITIEKNHKFYLKGKIKNYKNFNKKAKGKKNKSKVERPNWKT